MLRDDLNFFIDTAPCKKGGGTVEPDLYLHIADRVKAAAPSLWRSYSKKREGGEEFSDELVKLYKTVMDEALSLSEDIELVHWYRSIEIGKADVAISVFRLHNFISVSLLHSEDPDSGWRPLRKWKMTQIEDDA